MKTSAITARFVSDVRNVWGIVIDNGDYAWRSDLDRVGVSADGIVFPEICIAFFFDISFLILSRFKAFYFTSINIRRQ